MAIVSISAFKTHVARELTSASNLFPLGIPSCLIFFLLSFFSLSSPSLLLLFLLTILTLFTFSLLVTFLSIPTYLFPYHHVTVPPSPHVMDYFPSAMELDGASRTQAPPAHTHREETEEYSSQPPEASSSTLERTQSSVEANPSVVGESATANSQTPLAPNSARDRILQQEDIIRELVNQYFPGLSADPFLDFYKGPRGQPRGEPTGQPRGQPTGQPTDDMASRSGNRGKSCIL